MIKVDLSNVSTFDLVDALKDRKDVQYVINDRSSADWAVMIGKGELRVGHGEATILMVEGNY